LPAIPPAAPPEPPAPPRPPEPPLALPPVPVAPPTVLPSGRVVIGEHSVPTVLGMNTDLSMQIVSPVAFGTVVLVIETWISALF
jgi:hypothetical protein